jgi:hypothetical protein
MTSKPKLMDNEDFKPSQTLDINTKIKEVEEVEKKL